MVSEMSGVVAVIPSLTSDGKMRIPSVSINVPATEAVSVGQGGTIRIGPCE